MRAERGFRTLAPLDRYFLSVADKHHGHEDDFLDALFVTDLMGVPVTDESGALIWRARECTTEDDLPIDENDLTDDDLQDLGF